MRRASTTIPASSSGRPRVSGEGRAALPNGAAGKYIPWITVKPVSGVAFSIPRRPKHRSVIIDQDLEGKINSSAFA